MRLYKIKGTSTIENKKIPGLPGVYFLWSKERLLYIGCSNNVRKRIAQHFSTSFMTKRQVNPDNVWKVSIIFTRDKFDALRLESHLIKIIPTVNNGEENWWCNHELYWHWVNEIGIYEKEEK